ncbi:unnamed protein product [Brassica oleracea]
MMMMTSLGGGGVDGGGGGRFMTYSSSLSVPPSAPHSPSYSGGIRSQSSVFVEQEKYLSELLEERHKLTPFFPILPHAQILRVTRLLENAAVLSQSGFHHPSPLGNGRIFQNARADMRGWGASQFPSEQNIRVIVATGCTILISMERKSILSSPGPNWLNSPGSPSGLIAKQTIRIDIPADDYPNFNFVGRFLGPRGNSLNRVEASTDCRVLIRGRGSILIYYFRKC